MFDKFFSKKQSPAKIQEQANYDIYAKKTGETYTNYGKRICAVASGSEKTLIIYLQQAYNYSYQAQREDEEHQKTEKEKIRNQIDQKENDLDLIQKKQKQCQDNQEEKRKEISDLKDEINRIKEKAFQTNKDEKAKMTIGLFIIVPLTIYLFIFYSSTFYSAFFGTPQDGGVAAKMFNSQAIMDAYNTSLGALLFVLFAPVLFLGLGFTLHYFSEEKDRKRFLKMGAILVTTVLFDLLLAFKIGDMEFSFKQMIGQVPIDSTYGLSEAIQDKNFWIVIFCGFIAYIIWGLMFDLIMTAYGNLDLNKINRKANEEKIKKIEKDIQDEKNNENEYSQKIGQLKKEITSMEEKVKNNVFFNLSIIEKDVTDFYAGWSAQMQFLNLRPEDIDTTLETYENFKNKQFKKSN